MVINICKCILCTSKLQTTCWKWEMAEFSKVWHLLLWNKLRGRVTRANAWKQYEVDRDFIISHWFSVFCSKHTPGNILKIFSCKSPGTELSQTGRGSPWVEWWNSGCVFLAPIPHLHPPPKHTHHPHPLSPAGGQVSEYLTQQKSGNVEQPKGRKGLREDKTSNHSCQFPLPLLLAKKKSRLHLALSLPVDFLSTRELYSYLRILEEFSQTPVKEFFCGVIPGTPTSSGSNLVSAHGKASPIFASPSSCSEVQPRWQKRELQVFKVPVQSFLRILSHWGDWLS